MKLPEEKRAELGRIKEQNIGKWIAVKDKKVVSLSEDFHELMKELSHSTNNLP